MPTYTTKTGYTLEVSTVSPFAFSDLREKYRIYEDRFVYTETVPETGAELSFIYDPPDVQPISPADGGDQWTWEIWQRYRAWKFDYDNRMLAYRADRRKLLLALAIEIVECPDGKDLETELAEGKWIGKLAAGGIEVTDVNRYVLYVKTEVLKHETDMDAVAEMAVVEEVEMADLVEAITRFQSVLERLAAGTALSSDARQRFFQLLTLLGVEDSVRDALDGEAVVQSDGGGTGQDDSG